MKEIQPGLTVSKKDLPLRSRPIGASNGEDKQPKGVMRVLTGLISRLQLANRAGLQFGGKRDLYDVFGYKKQLTTDDFLGKYIRQDICARIIDAPPDATWSNPPELEAEEALVNAWDTMVKVHDIFGTLNRVDRLARLNHFSVLLLGVNDKELLWMRAVGSRQVDSIKFNNNQRDPRFGQPMSYKIRFDDPALKSISSGSVTVEGLKDIVVPHERAIHIVEKPLEDNVTGIPIIEKVYNLLDDLLKVGGGTSEMYWLSARAGLQADIDPEMDLDPGDAALLSEEIEEYQHQLRRVIRTRGVTLKDLGSETPSPKDIFDMLLGLISGTTGIPKRILLGSEAGELASAQDRANWAERIDERRSLFCEPRVLNPLVLRFQTLGLLPEGEFEWEWKSAFLQNPLEEGQTMAQKARAIGNISRQTGNQMPMQLTTREEARNIIGLEGDLAESDIMETIPPVEPQEEGDDQFGADKDKDDKDKDKSKKPEEDE